MAFYKYDTIEGLNDSREDWILRVRAQAIWKGITKQTGEFRGYNIIFFDDYSSRIHAFITAAIVPQFQKKLEEDQIYELETFKVKTYNGDESNRAVRNDKHIYFTADTKLEKETIPGIKIPKHSFDIFNLEDMEAMKNDNRFLTDIVGVIEDVQPKVSYTKNSEEKSHVRFVISDGRTTLNVTFFNDLGNNFLETYQTADTKPVIIIIACVKVSEWKEVLNLTNFPATRFYLNTDHSAVDMLRQRLAMPNFYVMDIDDDEEVCEVPIMKISEIQKLNEAYVEKKVACEITVKKFDEKMNWYSPFCIECDEDINAVDGKYFCTTKTCQRNYPYPDKRFRLYSLCSDDTGTIPIVWPDDEICRLTGKTVYDVEAEESKVEGRNKIPELLKSFEKKNYKITIVLKDKNVKQGSKVYMASNISNPIEMSGNHSPTQNVNVDVKETELTMISAEKDLICKDFSPPSEKSSNKCRPRISWEDVDNQVAKEPKLKTVKLEKTSFLPNITAMSTTTSDYLRNVNTGRTDWKVKIRIIRQWRIVTRTGQVFKGFNLLLLDSKNCRMHAFVPGGLADKISRMFKVGKLYILKNSQVKEYTEQDKFRAIHMNRKIVFTADTKLKAIDENEIHIPGNMFDLYEFADLKKMATQTLYLTDVIGILHKKEKLNIYEKDGKQQVNIRFKLTDGRKKINVTFWDTLAEDFEGEITGNLEQPIIIIIASGRVTSWKDVNISVQYRLKEPNFSKHQFSTTNKTSPICTISDIKTLGKEFVQEQVVCKAKVKVVEETKNWRKDFCTSCYSETETQNAEQYCNYCKRMVPQPLKRFHVSIVASDESGGIEMILKDREVRILLGKNVEEVENEEDSFPTCIKNLQGMEYSFKVLITEDNVLKRDFDYVVTNIVVGWDFQQEIQQEQNILQNTQSLTTEPSGSSYHLDNMSQLNCTGTG
ncbi:hypothetical protein POM88_052264 [Heracleum sosnowskyi]|uniref:Replication protein A 70 kDa DNA-binding subunit B/D first OB fold domain-containing protein n=1 Tax=Heracleum sosnowskyi TaxID=360622 RepID=A0AAD8LZC2_9APIA|nr:hypothetical protein POM88_052264 [Heracleum sosnowskyi]